MVGLAGVFRGASGSGARVGSLNGSEVVASHPSMRLPNTLGTIGETAGGGSISVLGVARLRSSGVLVLFGSERFVVSSDFGDLAEVFSRGAVAGFRLISFVAGVLGVVISVDELFW
jgi:hypothetical protein